jgi:hypothetical protein
MLKSAFERKLQLLRARFLDSGQLKKKITCIGRATKDFNVVGSRLSGPAGLPDFSRYNIPIMRRNLPNDHKMYKIICPAAVKYTKYPKT